MATQGNWTRHETLAALHLYLQLPFGQLHQRQPKIKQFSSWIGRTPGAVALKLVNLASLDPQIVRSGRAGMSNASSLDRTIWEELQSHWDRVALEAAADYELLAATHNQLSAADVQDELTSFDEGRTRIATVEVRVNQARFRKAVLASYNATCCITGLQNEKLVVASHIVPWSEDAENRLNPQNGLCLSALHDRAYDRGLLTVLPDMTVRVAVDVLQRSTDSFTRDALLRYDGAPIKQPERFAPKVEFLQRHAVRFGFIG